MQGLHILAGVPKKGKSWLALWLCQQVAGGEKVWGHPTQQGTVLYPVSYTHLRMSDLRAVPAATVGALYLVGENTHAAVS